MIVVFWPGHSNLSFTSWKTEDAYPQGCTILALLKANCIPDLSFPSQLTKLLTIPLTDYILDHPHFSSLPICYILYFLTSFLYHTLKSQLAPLIILYVCTQLQNKTAAIDLLPKLLLSAEHNIFHCSLLFVDYL